MMSIWYTTVEQPLRLESYYCTNGIATMFGGLIGYAVGHITTGLPRWMYVFLIFGSLSITIGIVALIFLPDYREYFLPKSFQRRFVPLTSVSIDCQVSHRT